MPDLALRSGWLIDEAAEQLREANLPEPRRQALRIWGELIRNDVAEVFLTPAIEVDPAAAELYRRSIRRRACGEPLPHLTGQAGFRHLTLRCDRRALIPRPETEGLVTRLLDRVPTGRVADIGTGSGCIALSLALEGSYEQVVATELSSEALALARINRDLLSPSVELVQSNLCSALQPAVFDALIANPPYLTVTEFVGLDPSVRDWEPEVALVSGEDGLEATLRLLENGLGVLRPGGWLALEVDVNRALIAARRAAALGWEDVSVEVDLFGRERYLLARRSIRS
jgi:release factor glutamine methyltransferase